MQPRTTAEKASSGSKALERLLFDFLSRRSPLEPDLNGRRV